MNSKVIARGVWGGKRALPSLWDRFHCCDIVGVILELISNCSGLEVGQNGVKLECLQFSLNA